MWNARSELLKYGETNSKSNFEIVTRHALADEQEILNRLGMTAEDCDHCDLYWAFEGELFHVSVAASDSEQPKIAYHQNQMVEHGHSFYVLTHECPLYVHHIDFLLTFISEWIEGNTAILSEDHGDKPLCITSQDVLKKPET